MKGLIILIVLLCSSLAWANQYQYQEVGNYQEDGQIFTSLGDYNQYRAEKSRQQKIIDRLDKIYSMIADIEIKFMGKPDIIKSTTLITKAKSQSKNDMMKKCGKGLLNRQKC